MYKHIDISKKAELFWQVFAKGLLSKNLRHMTDVNDFLEIPLCFTVCYIPLYSIRYYWIYGKNNRAWDRYFPAAINYPFLKLIPSFLNGRFAIDGGAADNIPLYPLLRSDRPLPEGEDLDLILILHFDSRYDFRKDFSPEVPVMDLDLSICNNFRKDHYNYSREAMDERISKACEYGDRIMSRLLEGDLSREALKKKINEIFVEEHALRQHNLSMDRLWSYLNVIGKACRTDAHCVKKLY